MIRSLATIVTAILLCRPDMPRAEAEIYAGLLQKEARRRDFDPLTAVAIIQRESGWIPDVISANGEDYGLSQIRARYVGACRNDPDPVGAPSAECRRVHRKLLEPEANIQQMALAIEQNRALCRAKTGNANLPRWLASYQGLNRPARKQWCRPAARTWQVIALRERLIRATTQDEKRATIQPASQRRSQR